MKNINTNGIGYLSLILVLSFFLFHDIKLVLIGVIFSLYIINKDTLNRFITFITMKEEKKDKKIIDISKKKEYQNISENKRDSELKLAKSVEETGFIPRIE